MIMFKAACAAALLVAAVATEHVLTLAKHYTVAGTNPNGSRYSGTADIDVISNTTFQISWHIKGTGSSNGFGMRMGDTLSVTYLLGSAPGLATYRANGDGSFHGIWAIRGHDGNGTEVLTPAD
jgi:hypothetical protein